jgi:ketosteroid isomerase-like protein
MTRAAPYFRLIVTALLLCLSNSWAATMPALDATAGRVEDRQQLRVLLGNVESAISKLDVEEVIKLMEPDVIVTWQNGEVSRGPDQIRAYYNRMMKGSAPIVKKFSTKATLGGNAAFYDDSAIAYGTTVDRFELMEGLDFTLNGNWSTTVVKKNGQWKIAALHFSTNLFDNPLLNKAKQMAWVAAGAGVLAGMLLMLLIGRMRRKN